MSDLRRPKESETKTMNTIVNTNLASPYIPVAKSETESALRPKLRNICGASRNDQPKPVRLQSVLSLPTIISATGQPRLCREWSRNPHCIRPGHLL